MQRVFTKLPKSGNRFWRTPLVCLLFTAWTVQAEAQLLAQKTEPVSPVRQDNGRVSLKDALRTLTEKYKVNFGYHSTLADGQYTRSADWLSEKSLERSLKNLLMPLGLTYKKVGKTTYVIKSNASPSETTPVTEKKLGQAGVPLPAPLPDSARNEGLTQTTDGRFVNPVTVTGQVTDEKGDGIPGVSVVVKGTTTGTATDANGSYTLTAPDANAVLVFSFIGYVLQEVPVNGRTQLNVSLVPDIQTLSEVVVTGYTTERRKTLSSAITSVKAEELQNQPVARVDNLLQGRAAGVQVIQNNGAPGTNGTTIRIRGISSIRASSDPLIIVDGVPLNGFIEDVNPNDIESFEVLKDAAAAAIYGARAANGVILITTKRGGGKPKVTLNASYGIQNIARQYQMLSGPEQWEVMKEMFDNVNRPYENSYAQIRSGWDTTATTPWSELLLQDNAPVAEVNLGLRGGEGKVKYATSFNFFDQQGILKQSAFQRLTGRLNLDVEVSKRIRFGNSLSVIYAQPQTFNFEANGLYMNALVKNPLTPAYDASSRYFFVEPFTGGTGNPLASLNEIQRKNTRNHAIGNVFGEVDILKGLTFRTSWGIDYRQNQSSTFTPSTQNNQGRTSGDFDLGEVNQWINTNILTFTRQLGQHHTLSLLAVHEQQEFTNRAYSGDASNFPGDIVTTLNAASKIDNIGSNQSSYGLQSLAGRVTYTFKDKYIFSANVRRDGSSRFGSNNRFATFPSVSLAWNVSDESFMKGIAFINYLKIRGSAGQVGNQSGLGNFTNRGIYTTGAGYAGEPGTIPGAVPNPNLKWETTTQYNVGLEAGVLDDRITLVADAYVKRTDDLLLDRQLAQSSGVGNVTINLGKLENKGLEFALITRNLTGAFKWTTNFNIAFNRNKVLQLYGNPSDLIQVFAPQRTFGVDGLESIIVPGRPLGSVYGYRTDGIYARDEDNAEGLSWSGQPLVGGDIRYVDLNGDGRITPQDRTFIGRMQPLHTGGITNNFSYKGFSLDVFANWSYGNDIYNATRQALISMEVPGRNSTTEVRSRWRQQGDVASVPRAATGINGRNSLESEFFLEDGSYLRISNITLGYQIPAGVVQKLRLSSLRFYAVAYNPVIFTKYSGIDPDVRSFTGEGQYYIDFGAYPRARTFSLGLSLEL